MLRRLTVLVIVSAAACVLASSVTAAAANTTFVRNQVTTLQPVVKTVRVVL